MSQRLVGFLLHVLYGLHVDTSAYRPIDGSASSALQKSESIDDGDGNVSTKDEVGARPYQSCCSQGFCPTQGNLRQQRVAVISSVVLAGLASASFAWDYSDAYLSELCSKIKALPQEQECKVPVGGTEDATKAVQACLDKSQTAYVKLPAGEILIRKLRINGTGSLKVMRGTSAIAAGDFGNITSETKPNGSPWNSRGPSAEKISTTLVCNGTGGFDVVEGGALKLMGVKIRGCGGAEEEEFKAVFAAFSVTGIGSDLVLDSVFLYNSHSNGIAIRDGSDNSVFLFQSHVNNSEAYGARLVNGTRNRLVIDEGTLIEESQISGVGMVDGVANAVIVDGRSSINSSFDNGIYIDNGTDHMVTLDNGAGIANSLTGISIFSGVHHTIRLSKGAYIMWIGEETPTDEALHEAHTDDQTIGQGIALRKGLDHSIVVSKGSSISFVMHACIFLWAARGASVRIESEAYLSDSSSICIGVQSARRGHVVLADGAMIRNCTKGGIAIEYGLDFTMLMDSESKCIDSPECIRSWGRHYVRVLGGAGFYNSSGLGITVKEAHKVHLVDATFSDLDGDGVRTDATTHELVMENVSLKRIGGMAINAAGQRAQLEAILIEEAGGGVTMRAHEFIGRNIVVHKAEAALKLVGEVHAEVYDFNAIGNLHGIYCPVDIRENTRKITGVIRGIVYISTVQDFFCRNSVKFQTSFILRKSWWFTRRTVAVSTIFAVAFASTQPWIQLVDDFSQMNICSRVVISISGFFLVYDLFCVISLWKALYAEQEESVEEAICEGFAYVAVGCMMVPISWYVSRLAKNYLLLSAEDKRLAEELAYKQREDELIADMYKAIRDGNQDAIDETAADFVVLGWPKAKVVDYIKEQEAKHSEDGGIRVRYLTTEFIDLAREKSGLEDPCYYELKEPFFFAEGALGKDMICPRDGEKGVALIDYLPRPCRGECTHFLSWTWGYKVSMMAEALNDWLESSVGEDEDPFLFCCFFVNNQYRILVGGSGSGAENLEVVFEGCLLKIGRVVALLDHWDQPRYLSRVWTIFEQYTAVKLNIPVTMILPPDASESLIDELETGKAGIGRVMEALSKVDSASSQASCEADEVKVKDLIRNSIGFETVNTEVARSMIHWIGVVVRKHFEELMEGGAEGEVKPPLA